MEIVNLGNTGLRVSRLCFGAMSFGASNQRAWGVGDEETCQSFVRTALEGGMNFFDTAEVYQNGQSEEILGRALDKFVSNREDIVIATKVNGGTSGRAENRWGLSRKHIMNQVDQSLKRLGTDYIDLYQIHRWDYRTPIEETLDALTDCIRAGKVRYIGASSMWAWQFERALSTAEKHGYARFVSMQNQYSLVYREEEREMIPLCRDRKIAVIPWGPIAAGFLAGNRTREGEARTLRAETGRNWSKGETENNFDILDRVIEVAARHGKTSAQIAMAWVLAQPGVTAPITGMTKPGQLESTIEAAEIKLSPDEIAYLAELYEPHRVSDHQ